MGAQTFKARGARKHHDTLPAPIAIVASLFRHLERAALRATGLQECSCELVSISLLKCNRRGGSAAHDQLSRLDIIAALLVEHRGGDLFRYYSGQRPAGPKL